MKLFSYGVVLTGSIATGKSSIASFLKKDGFVLIDADKVAHTILDEQKNKIIELFGSSIVEDEKIDRKLLGAMVFNNTFKRKQLEDILHPLIFEKIAYEGELNDRLKKLYFLDIPLFFENKNYDISKSLIVYTPLTQQLLRLMKRNNYSQEEAQKRIDTQISIEEKVKRATYIIDNSATLIELKKAYQKVIVQIEKDFR